jgi:hypothetical protein
VLVVGVAAVGPTVELVAWVVDPATTTTTTGPSLPGISADHFSAGWLDGHWVLMAWADGHNSVWVSPDAISWSQIALPDVAHGDMEPLSEGGGALTVGPAGVVLTRGGGFDPGDTWYSPDLSDWQLVLEHDLEDDVVYSDTLGFAGLGGGDGGLMVSSDGKAWRVVGLVPGDAYLEAKLAVSTLLAASDGKLLFQSTVQGMSQRLSDLWLWSESELPTPQTPPTPRESQFVEELMDEWAEAWRDADAARVAALFRVDGIYGDHQGRYEIEAALRDHLRDVDYITTETKGFMVGEPYLSDHGRVFQAWFEWVWIGIRNGETSFVLPVLTTLEIGYDDGLIVSSSHSYEVESSP